MTLTGVPAHNPATGARRYTGAEFVIRLREVNRTSSIDLQPAPAKPTTKRARRKPRR
jgi:hypothetical protein